MTIYSFDVLLSLFGQNQSSLAEISISCVVYLRSALETLVEDPEPESETQHTGTHTHSSGGALKLRAKDSPVVSQKLITEPDALPHISGSHVEFLAL